MNASDQFTNPDGYHGTTVTIKPKGDGLSQPVASSGNTSTWTVFLSSTVKDLQEYRQEVQDALLKRAQVACFLSEDWLNNYKSAIQKCKTEIQNANGYIGIFAYWYGYVPKGRKRSITHLEFTWALKKWKTNIDPPIAILMPASPSDAEDDLKQKAASLIPPDEDEQKVHAELLLGFRKWVTQTGFTVRWFKNQQELREWVIAFGMQWKGARPLAAAKGDVQVIEKSVSTRRVTDEEWGLLGRQPQLDIFDKILNRVLLYPTVPAVAILVHGNETAGQRVFLKQLLTKKKLRSGRPVLSGRPQFEQYGVKALMQWVGESLGVVTQGVEVTSLTQLADLIYEELQDQQLCFMLDQVFRVSGGVTTFYTDFWQPVYARLAELWDRKPAPYRLIAVVLDYADQPDLPDTIAVDWKPATTADDYARLLKLPVLGEITADDLIDWFSTLEIPADTLGNRLSLVNAALNTTVGKVDGTPLLVFDRLSRVELWPEGDV